MASDLRTIVSVLNIITELERIGDYAEGNAKNHHHDWQRAAVETLVDIPRMAEKTADMLNRSLTAFINHDADAAIKISAEDDFIDNLYDQVFRNYLLLCGRPENYYQATRLIWVTHNLERSADRVTNICERVVFMVTGKMEESNTSSSY